MNATPTPPDCRHDGGAASAWYSELLREAFKDMDSDGMCPADWTCKVCGKLLNADGSHPAELYAGTYTGLCYSCERSTGYIVRVLRDAGQVWSFPPHCPSWSRAREEKTYYPGCPDCPGPDGLRHYVGGGPGFTWSRDHGLGPRYRVSCDTCIARHSADPLRRRYFRHMKIVWDVPYVRFDREKKRARRRLKLKHGEELPPEVVGQIARPIRQQRDRVAQLVKAWAERVGVFA